MDMQLRGDKEIYNTYCPFSGVTSSGRVWRKVPESDARSEMGHERFVVSKSDQMRSRESVRPTVTINSNNNNRQ